MNIIELAELADVRGFLHPDEAIKLMNLASHKDVLELGAFCGLSAFCMAITAKSVLSLDHFCAATNGTRNTGQLTTLDDYNRAVARFTNVLPPVVETSERAATYVHGPFDFIFIDACHEYEAVRDDIQRWWPKLKPGGVMAFHDYRHGDYPGVEKAVDEIFGPAPDGTTIITLRWVQKP